jgi:hypothetical protein
MEQFIFRELSQPTLNCTVNESGHCIADLGKPNGWP